MNEFLPVNSFANASLDVFKIDDVTEDPTIDLNKLATIDMNESYFIKALKFIKETNDELSNSKIELYKKISEATEIVPLMESFNDYFGKVSNIVDVFCRFISGLFDRFAIALLNFVSQDRNLKEHKKDLEEFDNSMTFNYDNGFIYTLIDDSSVPQAKAITKFNESDSLISYLASSSDLNAESIRRAMAGLDLSADYDQFRGLVLQRMEPISESEYADVLFRIFRNGEKDSRPIDVNKSIVKKSIDRYFNVNKFKVETNREYKDIEKEYKNIIKSVKDITSKGNVNLNAFLHFFNKSGRIKTINGSNINEYDILSKDMSVALDTFIKLKVSQLKNYSDIHLLAYTAKLDAIKEAVIQDRNILNQALRSVIDAKIESGGN